MRSKTLLVSAAIHAALAGLALRAATTSGPRGPIEITIAAPRPTAHDEAKPEPTAPPAEAPRLAPVRAKSVSAPATPEPAAEPAAPSPPSRHVDIGVSMSNADAPGIAVPPREPSAPTGSPVRGAPAPAEAPPRDKVLGAPKTAAPGDDCTEAATKPVPTSRPTSIEYTTQARADGAEGRLVLAITVAPDGSVASVALKSGVHASIDAAAMSAVRAWRFTPAMRCGKPVEAVYTLARRFELGN